MLPSLAAYSSTYSASRHLDAGDSNASSTAFASNLRGYACAEKEETNPFSGSWLVSQMKECGDEVHFERMKTLDAQIESLNAQMNVLNTQNRNLEKIAKILERSVKQYVGDKIPEKFREQWRKEGGNDVGSLKDRLGVTGKKTFFVDPMAHALIHKYKDYNPRPISNFRARKRTVRTLTVRKDPPPSDEEDPLHYDEEEPFDEEEPLHFDKEDMRPEGETLHTPDTPESDDSNAPCIFDRQWKLFLDYVEMMRDQKAIEKARRIRRAKRYQKLLKHQFMFSWSKRKQKMIAFIEKETATWVEKRSSRKLKGTAKLIGMLVADKKKKNKEKSKKKNKTKSVNDAGDQKKNVFKNSAQEIIKDIKKSKKEKKDKKLKRPKKGKDPPGASSESSTEVKAEKSRDDEKNRKQKKEKSSKSLKNGKKKKKSSQSFEEDSPKKKEEKKNTEVDEKQQKKKKKNSKKNKEKKNKG